MRELHVEEIECKTILNKSVMGFTDYTLNAYQGCAFACSYCYVPAMRERRGQIDERRWGGWVQVKVNAPDVLRRQMLRLAPEARIAIGTATDSWQSLEKRYEIARRILQELVHYPNPVNLLTRSPLLLRDIDVLQQMADVSVGVSLPTFDEAARRAFEPLAPTVKGRVHLIGKLVEAGLTPSLFLCPILPGVADSADAVRNYFRNAADLGVRRVICGMLNYTEKVGAPHMRLLRQYRQTAGPPSSPSLARTRLSEEVARWSAHYGIDARL